jgi:hypothetical protein
MGVSTERVMPNNSFKRTALTGCHLTLAILPSEIEMRKSLIAIVVVLSFISSSLAASPTTQSIEKLLTLTKAESLITSMYANLEATMRQSMAQAVGGRPLSTEQKRYLDAVPKQFVKVMQEELSWESLKPTYIEIYQDTFDQEEIDGLVAFYQSPLGSAMVNKMPLVIQKSMASMQSRLQPMLERMKGAMEQALRDAKVAN